MLLSEDYIVSKFYQYAGYPKYNRLSKAYNGCCPTCREGSSWGKKRRLYFVTRKNLIFCHNCGISMRPAKWIQKVSNALYVNLFSIKIIRLANVLRGPLFIIYLKLFWKVYICTTTKQIMKIAMIVGMIYIQNSSIDHCTI